MGENVNSFPGKISLYLSIIVQHNEVPDYWKTYVEEVDQEQELWLNSFYKAPLRLPMPAELEHWWEKETKNWKLGIPCGCSDRSKEIEIEQYWSKSQPNRR
ncbi:hypothetical protein Dimus_013301 [Dionaea muscipula]